MVKENSKNTCPAPVFLREADFGLVAGCGQWQSKGERKNELGEKVLLSTRAEISDVSGMVYVHMTPFSFYAGARLFLVNKSVN